MKQMIKMVRPDYYDRFFCIAADCSFTCCQDWEITVDAKTKKKWESVPVPETMKTGKKYLKEYTHLIMGGDAIDLEPNGHCPFLNEQGLCHIVKQYGEEMISHTCHVYPRERHVFSGRIEESLNLGCPEVLRLLWEKTEFSTVSQEHAGQSRKIDPDGSRLLFDLRDRMVDFLKQREIPLADAWKMLFYMILQLEQEERPLTTALVDELLETHFLTQLLDAVQKAQPDPYDRVNEQNELFLDLAENYRKKKIYADVIEPLAEQAEYYEDEESSELLKERRDAFEPEWSALEDRIRVLMQEELYATLYLPGGSLFFMVMKMEWMGIFYGVLQQMLFLSWDRNGMLADAGIRQIIQVLIRMTGYNEEDIEEYLENSFEDIIWDWGYMALII